METITPEMNAGEALAVMNAITFYLEHLNTLAPNNQVESEMAHLLSFVAKARPLISQQAAKSRQKDRDALN